MEPLTGPMAKALERGRETFNAKFAAAQRTDGRIDRDAFLHHLAKTVDPIIRAVEGEFAERTDAVTSALYDLSLELFAAVLLGPGAKCQDVPRAWEQLLPRVPRLLAREPRRIAAAITNAIHNIATTPGARADTWLKAMIALAPVCPTTQGLLDFGKLMAWRAGMAHYRPGALAIAAGIEPALAVRALGLPENTPAESLPRVVERLGANPWLRPAECLSSSDALTPAFVFASGGFRGFGGLFLAPPRVWIFDGEIFASDGKITAQLLADSHNALLIQTDEISPAKAAVDARVSPEGTIHWGQETARFENLANPTSAAANVHTIAITLANSHQVFLIGRVPMRRADQ